MMSSGTRSNNDNQRALGPQSAGDIAPSACGTCGVSANCSLDELQLLPHGALEDSAGLDRFLKTVKKPEAVERIAGLLQKQARIVPPRIIGSEKSLGNSSSDQ